MPRKRKPAPDYSNLPGRPTVCIRCGTRRPDSKSRKGYCYVCLEAANQAWKNLIRAKCEHAAARNEAFAAQVKALQEIAEKIGVKEITVPGRTSFAYYLVKQGIGKRKYGPRAGITLDFAVASGEAAKDWEIPGF
jgi:hypothetical protein